MQEGRMQILAGGVFYSLLMLTYTGAPQYRPALGSSATEQW